MFWSRSGREARRRKVLDELLELDPQDRPGRLESAVASGDVRADEVHDALQLVSRLDALRLMTLPSKGLKTTLPGAVRVHPAPATDEATGDDSERTEPAASEPAVEAVPEGKARRRRRPRNRAAGLSEDAPSEVVAPTEIEVPVDLAVPAVPVVEATPAGAQPIPPDLLETAARQVARELSARRSHGAARSSRARRLHAVALSDSRHHVEPVPAGDAPSEASWPDISWLRP
jgi:hypothetical protein